MTGFVQQQTENQTDTELYEAIQEYNHYLYEDGQKELYDPEQFRQMPAIEGLEAYETFGYIEIPAMNCVLPLYIGASEQHLDQGAAVLGGTSVPVGGKHTNSIIAGHRGWHQKPYFKQIEQLQIGDPVYLTNPWERLTYCVEKIQIIEPEDVEQIRIQPERDMITLMTCHPYRTGGKYRYLVFCTRQSEAADVMPEQKNEEEKSTMKAAENEITDKEIVMEQEFRYICLIILCGIVGSVIWKNRREGRRSENDRKKVHRKKADRMGDDDQ